MDEKDRQLIAALQADGRLTNQDLAERINLSPSPCLRRLRMLEEANVIRGYTAIIDEGAYGLPVTAFVRVRLQKHSSDAVAAFEAAIQRVDSILDCYVMTGSDDYLLRVLVESLKDYEQFVRSRLHPIPGIASIDTSFAYGVVKRSPVFPKLRRG
nr:Lrp/AsnC family transcriptional regulator [uncultured Roseococcus sp.]